jgi:GGDEF domain-containing protein
MSQDSAPWRHYDQQLIAALQQKQGKQAVRLEEIEADKAFLELENRRLTDELEAAQIDARTGLHNTNSFVAGCKRYEPDDVTGIALHDLSNFKNLNDYVSYAVGNQYLRRAADAALKVADSLGLPARAVTRAGGDEIGGFIPIGLGWEYVRRVEEEFGELRFDTPEGVFVVRLCGGSSDGLDGQQPPAAPGTKFVTAEVAMKVGKREFYARELDAGHLISRSKPQS